MIVVPIQLEKTYIESMLSPIKSYSYTCLPTFLSSQYQSPYPRQLVYMFEVVLELLNIVAHTGTIILYKPDLLSTSNQHLIVMLGL